MFVDTFADIIEFSVSINSFRFLIDAQSNVKMSVTQQLRGFRYFLSIYSEHMLNFFSDFSNHFRRIQQIDKYCYMKKISHQRSIFNNLSLSILIESKYDCIHFESQNQLSKQFM